MYILGTEEIRESEVGFKMLCCKQVEVSSGLPSKVSLQYIDGKVILHKDPDSPKADYKNLWNGKGFGFGPNIPYKIKVPIKLMNKVGWSEDDTLIIKGIDEDTASVEAEK